MDKNENRKLLLRVFSVFVFIGLLGAVKPVLFNGGSSGAKYLAKQQQLEMIDEQNVEQYMESALFGDGEAVLESSEVSFTEEERTEAVNAIYKYDAIIAVCLLFFALLLFFPSFMENKHLYHILIPISIWLFLISVASMLNGGKRFSEFSIIAHSTRWGLPLLLWLLFYMKDKVESKIAAYPAILFCSFTFAVHGWEAYMLNPPFQDLIYQFFSIFGLSVSESVNFGILRAVGCMDLLLAASIMFFQKPKIFLWMAFWGFVTALSRPLTIGLEAWPEFAMRIANCALPFYLFLRYRNQRASVMKPEFETQNMEMIYE